MKKKLLLCILSVVSIAVIGQQQPSYEKKIYIAPDGKMYINKALPLYLRIATSPDEDAKTYLLRSEQTAKYSNPMYLDTEGYNTFRSPSAVDTVTKQTVYPIQDIIFEVYSDSRPPVTKLEYSEAKPFNKQDKVYINGSVDLTLKSSDATSGVENIYVSVDGSSYNVYKDALKLEQEKEYTVKYYAVDNVGNVEEVHSIDLVIDKSSPKTSYEVEGDLFENVVSSRSKISLKSDDGQGVGTASVFYKVDDGPEKKYTTPVMAAFLPQGDHTLIFYSKDNVGNTENEQTFKFYVDKTPPVIVQEILGKSFFAGGKEYSSGRSQLKLTTFDNKAGVKEVFYSLNGNEYKKYEKPFLLSNITGNLTVRAYALDKVNNKTESIESGDKTTIPYVDLTGPSVKYGFSGPVFAMRDTIYISKKTKILLKSEDSESGLSKIEYTINDDSIHVYQDEFSIDHQGTHTIKITAFDNVENTSNSQFVVVVDNAGPEIFSRFSINPTQKKGSEGKILEEYPSHVVLFLSCTDGIVGFDQMFYSINGAPEKKYAGLINTFPKKGEYVIKVRAQDKLGNETNENIDFMIGD